MAEVINLSTERKPESAPETKKGFLSSFSFFKKADKEGGKPKKKKKIELIVAGVLIVVILIIYFSSMDIFSSSSGGSASDAYTAYYEYCGDMESKLNKALSGINGAGKVYAVVNFESSAEIIIAYNETQNKSGTTDSTGKYNENTQSSKTPVTINNNGNQIPIILKTVHPKVKGVLITAQGAGNVSVKNELISSTATLLAISPGLVYVTVMGKL